MLCSVKAWAILAALVAYVVYLFIGSNSNHLPVHVDGTVDPKFKRVKEVFTQNFNQGWERDGASLSVYVKGKKVVDLWGGYSDREALRKWKEDTISTIFSASKGVASLCVAMLVDRGHLSYDDLVTKHWPEFGQNGKNNVTVGMLLSHQAGLSYFDGVVTMEDAKDHRRMAKKIEQQHPNWPPGTHAAYHAFTHGWLTDQIIRHTDPKKRGIGQFVREELRDAYGIDLHLGLQKEEAIRVARLYKTGAIDGVRELLVDHENLRDFIEIYKQIMWPGSKAMNAFNIVPWIRLFDSLTVNDPEVWQIEQAGALGIGNARSLAQLYDLVVRKQLISAKTLALLQKPLAQLTIAGHKINVSSGLFIGQYNRAGADKMVGHAGYGCQHALMDINNEIAISYTTNGLKLVITEGCVTWSRLKAAIYDAIEGRS